MVFVFAVIIFIKYNLFFIFGYLFVIVFIVIIYVIMFF